MAPVVAICAADFHADDGHRVSASWPPGALTPEEMRDVAFSSLPDSLSFELQLCSSIRDSSFVFRIRRRGADGPRPGYLYGFVFCRQRVDEALRRGGDQRSLVVLSHFPLCAVLRPLSHYIGPMLVTAGAEAFPQIWLELAVWPELRWGTHLAMSLAPLASLSVDLPSPSTLPLDAPRNWGAALEAAAGTSAAAARGPGPSGTGAVALDAALVGELDPELGLPPWLLPPEYAVGAGDEGLTGPFDWDADVYTPLRPLLDHLWALWEMALLGEPLLVMSPTPGRCSSVVLAILSLLAPFPPPADWRPYFTIADPLFPALAAGELPNAANGLPTLLGATNPQILKALPDFPNVISSGYTAATLPPSPIGADPPPASWASSGAARLVGLLSRRLSRPGGLVDHPADRAWISFRPASRPDRALLATLAHPGPADLPDRQRRIAAANTATLRRHFRALTCAVLAPLAPYISPEPPATEYDPPTPLPPLDPEALLAELAAPDAAHSLPPLLLERFGGQRGAVAFYQRFLASPPLRAWLAQRRRVALDWQLAYSQALAAEKYFGAPPPQHSLQQLGLGGGYEARSLVATLGGMY